MKRQIAGNPLSLRKRALIVAIAALVSALCLAGCSSDASEKDSASQQATSISPVYAKELISPVVTVAESVSHNDEMLRSKLNIREDYRKDFDHGEKGAEYQKYIVLHDTEGEGTGASVVEFWEGNGNKIAAHFVIEKNGTITQCVPLDRIAHHAGFGDTGHNEEFGVVDESRDDKIGTQSVGSWASDYGMNSYSVGIEMVHVGASGEDYPKAQLEALDALIAYIDAYFGVESKIIDHKTWRSGNSDTSAAFAKYLKNYQKTRTHDGK